MYTQLNKKYTALCARLGVQVQIQTVTAPDAPRSRLRQEADGLILEVSAHAPAWLGYEKHLVWGVRDVLLPRLVLETPRLRLRRFCKEDGEHCFAFLSDPEDCYMDCCRAFSEKDGAYYQRVELLVQRESQYAVTLKESGELIGALYVFPDTARAVDALEIGYCIARTHQRKGYATEMLTAMLKLLQEQLLVDTVSAGVLPENGKSMDLLRKLGFQPEGLRHHGVWHEALDKPVDLQYFYRDRD